MDTNIKEVIKWLIDGETGMSSKNILRFLLNGKSDGSYPLDPADLRRCIEMINKTGMRSEFYSRMPKEGPVWRELISIWSLLEATFDYEKRTTTNNSAPKTYQLMQEAISKGRSQIKTEVEF